MWRMLVCLGVRDSIPLSTHSGAVASSTIYSVPRGFERMGFSVAPGKALCEKHYVKKRYAKKFFSKSIIRKRSSRKITIQKDSAQKNRGGLIRSPLLYISPYRARDGNRTRTGISAHRILSPACLPIPPPEQKRKYFQERFMPACQFAGLSVQR